MGDIRTALEAAGAYLTAHPSEAAYTDSAATASLEDGLRVSVSGPGGEALTTDMPASVGGGATAPSPGWLLRAAEAACAATLIAMRAAALGIALDRLEVVVDSESDDRGILGLSADVPAGPLSGRVVVKIAAKDVPGGDLFALARWGVDHCPVVDAVQRAVPIEVEVLVEASRASSGPDNPGSAEQAAGGGRRAAVGPTWPPDPGFNSCLTARSEFGPELSGRPRISTCD
jgi:uncharacterized OsmC-like protein